MKLLDRVNNQQMLPEKYRQMKREEMEKRVSDIKESFAERLFIPGHHYQKDEVIQFADATGDSLQLARLSAQNEAAEFIVFLGVHFMAETADILTEDHQTVILPDMKAGCSMADMADIHQLNRAWKIMQDQFDDTVLPLTYVNSTAAIKAFCGEHGGATVTSSNAKDMLKWAFSKKERILFLPDQHLGRNTAYELGIPLDDMAVWDPIHDRLEYDGELDRIKMILWKGHCSVHEKFTVEHVRQIRENDADVNILVHPECNYDVVRLADFCGSTNFIIRTIEQAPPNSKWAIGTEMNLVNRLIAMHPNKQIQSLNSTMCPCLTMNRIDLPHLLWTLDNLANGRILNRIQVKEPIASNAKLALERMLRK